MELQLNQKAKCRCAIYARYSGSRQSPESANDQIERIKHHVERGTLRLVKYPQDQYELLIDSSRVFKDEAVSGRVSARQDYEKVRDGIRRNDFDVLIVDDLSRITRELGDQIAFYNLLKFHGVELFSLCEGISSEGSNAKVFFQIKGIVNDLGNDIHGQRTKRGQEARLLKGQSCGDQCYGYGSRPTTFRQVGSREVPSNYELFIIPEHAIIVNLIYDLKLKGLGYTAIAKYLNERNIESSSRAFGYTGKKCNWHGSSIRHVLTQEKYVGIWRRGKTTNVRHPESDRRIKRKVPPNEWVQHFGKDHVREDLVIVSYEKWRQVQDLIESTTRDYRKASNVQNVVRGFSAVGTKGDHVLSGILRCHECSSTLVIATAQKGGFYGCFDHKSTGNCKNNSLLSRAKVEKAVVEFVKTVLLAPSHLESAVNMLNDRVKKKLGAAPEELKILEKQKLEAQRQLQNLITYIASQGDSSTAVRDALKSKEMEAHRTEERIRILKSSCEDKLLLTPFALRSRYERLLELFESNSVVANAALRKLFYEGLVCKPERQKLKDYKGRSRYVWNIEGCVSVGEESWFSPPTVGALDAHTKKTLG